MAQEQMTLRGTLQGHGGWVTQIATNPQYPDTILSASRDKSLILWKLTRDETNYGMPYKSLMGHGHFVSDVVLSSDGQFALSSSWDKTLRLWDLVEGKTTRRFVGHEHDVMSVLSLLITDRLCLHPETRPSSCGTLLVFASTPFRKIPTRTGCPVSASLPMPRTQSLCHVDGTELSRFGI